MTDQTMPSRHPDHPVAPMFPARWSPRAFAETALRADQLKLVLEAARWAPSASNHQPWRLVWALRGEPGFTAILGALVPSNQVWAAQAGALIVVASKNTVTGKDGTSSPNPYATFDCGSAWMSMALQAHLSGLCAHAMAGFGAAALAAAVALPDGHTLHAVVAVGHPGNAADLPEKLQARETPSPRMSLAEISHHGRF